MRAFCLSSFPAMILSSTKTIKEKTWTRSRNFLASAVRPSFLLLLLLVVVVTSAFGEAIIGSNDIHGLQGKSNISTTPKVTKCVTQNEIRLVGAVGESFILIKLNAVSLRRVPYIPTTST